VTPWVLAGTTFAASAVEFVEAATIVLAVGVTHGWRTAIGGASVASLALFALVASGAPILMNAASLDWFELIVGPFLMLFGFAWLRKAVLRYAGRKAMHDENAIFARNVAALRSRENRAGFTVAFQGVFVEGVEVAVIVVTFSAPAPSLIAWSVGGALAAFAIVGAAAVALRAPFSRVPENALKALVGIMLLALGTLWTGEGMHIAWSFGEWTLALLAAIICAIACIATAILRLGRPSGRLSS
jgi:Ca2+/H+ antiporter, TMEM165/GDT1 family